MRRSAASGPHVNTALRPRPARTVVALVAGLLVLAPSAAWGRGSGATSPAGDGTVSSMNPGTTGIHYGDTVGFLADYPYAQDSGMTSGPAVDAKRSHHREAFRVLDTGWRLDQVPAEDRAEARVWVGCQQHGEWILSLGDFAWGTFRLDNSLGWIHGSQGWTGGAASCRADFYYYIWPADWPLSDFTWVPMGTVFFKVLG